MPKFIFITGGVVSSLGKGIVSSSIASLLKLSNFNVRIRKLDPYLNIDPGTMNPSQHGEVFVTDDGAETDMDLGHYERFTGTISRKSDNITTGKVYSEVLKKERRGDFLGSTVQVIPHVTDEIKNFIKADLKNEDFVICEIGGTVGDIESLPFLEALRQIRNELGKNKIALFCNLSNESVIMLENVKNIYQVPVKLNEEGILKQIYQHFNHKNFKNVKLSPWKKFINKFEKLDFIVKIAIVGKYTNLSESYKSLNEALFHSGISNNTRVDISWIDSRSLISLKVCEKILSKFDGILVPGGFGYDGSEGKILAIRFAKKKKIPFLGICYGMQLAILESIRTLKGFEKASSTEFGKTSLPVISMMHEWYKLKKKLKLNKDVLGGSMRLGSYESILKKNSKIHLIYKKNRIFERHRHRYEVNYNFIKEIELSGIIISGNSPDGKLIEVMERSDHPWFIGVQYHPELKSTPFKPHELINSYISASLKNRLSSKKNNFK